MAVPNPFAIDKNALHEASQLRLAAYAAMTGQEGVLGNDHWKIQALSTPGPKIQALPGGYSILAKHLGGSYEAYVGKIDVAETSETISATTSAGGRADLVILRVENPYVSGDGGPWPIPADVKEGPYVFLRVIEGVDDDVWDVAQYNSDWSAITLARIDRDANTNVVTQDDITELRSLAHLGGTRTVIINNPPADPPPIAEQLWTGTGSVGSDQDLPYTQQTFKDFPSEASWQVPVPEWATHADAFFVINAFQYTAATPGNVWGAAQLLFDGDASCVTRFDQDVIEGADIVGAPPNGLELRVMGPFDIDSSSRGRLVTVKLQARQYNDSSGNTKGSLRVRGRSSDVYGQINFKRSPS